MRHAPSALKLLAAFKLTGATVHFDALSHLKSELEKQSDGAPWDTDREPLLRFTSGSVLILVMLVTIGWVGFLAWYFAQFIGF